MPTDAITDGFVIDARFSGPPQSANGGYVGGRLASYLGGAVEVTLRRPPPLNQTLEVERPATDRVALVHGEVLLADARRAHVDLSLPAPVSYDEAERATERFRWRDGHPSPTCFVCGPHRDPGDGLRIFAGPVHGRNLVAAPWVPPAALALADGSMPIEMIWAALDCPGAMAFPEHVEGRAVLLGRMAVAQVGPVLAGRRHVVVAWPIAAEGRKLRVGSAIFTEGGHVRAMATAVWVKEVTPEGGIAAISSIAYGFMGSQALFAALELGLFDALAAGAQGMTELSRDLGISVEPLSTLMTALVSLGLVNREAERFVNSHAATRYLVRGFRGYVGDYYLKQVAGIMYPAVAQAGRVLRGAQPTYATFLDDPVRAEEFIRGQHTGSLGPAALLAKTADLVGVKHLLDLGGGSGAFSIELARRHPALTATVVDYPTVVTVARKIIDEEGFGHRVQCLAGDLWAAPWPPADGVLLSYIFSSYSATRVAELLRRIHSHLPVGGRILVHDFALEADREGPRNAALWFFANLAISQHTHPYVGLELIEALEHAGFVEVAAQPHIPNVTYLFTGRRV